MSLIRIKVIKEFLSVSNLYSTGYSSITELCSIFLTFLDVTPLSGDILISLYSQLRFPSSLLKTFFESMFFEEIPASKKALVRLWSTSPIKLSTSVADRFLPT